MEKSFKPTGYNSVSSYLIVDDAQETINMLDQVFDGKEKRIYSHTNGKIMNAEILIDDSIFSIADSSEKYPAYQLWIHVYVHDVNLTYKKAIEYGCESIDVPVRREGDPDCRGTFRDKSGNYWAIGTQMEH